MKQNNSPRTVSVNFPLFDVADFRFRPFDPSSRLSHEFPGEDCFDNRTDHLLFLRQKGVAVLITLANYGTEAPRPHSHRVGLSVSLLDSRTEVCVWSGIVYTTLGRDEALHTMRVDIPLLYSRVIADRDYTISVEPASGPDRERRGLRKTLRFYDLPVIRSLPTRWFQVDEAWIDNVFHPCSSNRYYIQPGPGFPDPLRFVFRVDIQKTMIQERPCQLEMRLHLPGGEILSEIVTPKTVFEDRPHHVEVIADFHIPKDAEGIAYVELCCMSYGFTGFAFRLGEEEKEGIRGFAELMPIPNFTPEAGLRRLEQEARRQADSETLPAPEDDFDRFLDDFIAREKAKISEDADDTSEPQTDNFSGDVSDNPADDPAGDSCADAPEDSGEGDAPEKTGREMLDALTGLEDVKNHIRQYADFTRFQQLRKAAGLPVLSLPLHSLFLGSPGTGKTTVAKIMGKLMKEAGVLSRGHVIVKERSVLLGQNYNSESEKTLEALNEARGGILFIDEAYQLYQPQDSRDPGRFVLETLMTALADESDRDWMLILAGYTEPMLRMLDLNPGLRSRIPSSNFYTFSDYTPAQLLEIGTRYLTDNGFTLTPEASGRLLTTILADHPTVSAAPSLPSSGQSSSPQATFGNARYILTMIQTRILPAAATRVLAAASSSSASPSATLLSEILPCDIPSPGTTLSPAPAVRRPLGFRA